MLLAFLKLVVRYKRIVIGDSSYETEGTRDCCGVVTTIELDLLETTKE